MKNFAKDNDILEIKGGLMEARCVSPAEVEAIASLPSREELIAQIAGHHLRRRSWSRCLPSTACRGTGSRSSKAVADQKTAA